MGDVKADKVNRAVRQGLIRCRITPAPIVALATFLDELRADSLWHPSEILIVEKAVRHILAQIVTRRSS